jgi:hypothetical protein
MIPALLALSVPTGFPEVTAADAFDDRSWFADRPERRFRARPGDGGVWLTRRRPRAADADVYLRAFSRSSMTSCPDNDGALAAALWFRAAYPDWPPEKLRKAAREELS